MKKIKSKKSNFKNKLVDLIKEVKKNPMGVVLDFFKQIKLYVTTNVFFCLFVLFNLINGVMIRYFSIGTTETLFAFQPFMADLAVVIALGALGYLMRHKIRVVYWYFITLLCTLVCIVNSVYYTFYSSYASVSLLSIAKYGDAVSDAIWDIIKFKDISYIIFSIFKNECKIIRLIAYNIIIIGHIDISIVIL